MQLQKKYPYSPYVYLHTQKGEGTGISWGGGFCFKRVGALEEFSFVREVWIFNGNMPF